MTRVSQASVEPARRQPGRAGRMRRCLGWLRAAAAGWGLACSPCIFAQNSPGPDVPSLGAPLTSGNTDARWIGLGGDRCADETTRAASVFDIELRPELFPELRAQ